VAFSSQRDGCVDGAVLSPSAFVLRFFADDHRDDRLLVVNLGGDLVRASIAEPLIAPPEGLDWDLQWSSEDPRYGGAGTPAVWPGWWIRGESAVVYSPGSMRPRPLRVLQRRTG
jgi:maltooligosyltrehalose trehalohydrolase